MESKYLLIPPSFKELLNLEYIGIHEAAFLLCDWPTHEGEHYFPNPMEPFNPKEYDGRFNLIFSELNNAVTYRELHCKRYTAILGVALSVRPYDVIIWALLKNKILPKPLQAVLGLSQMPSSDFNRSRNAFINKVIFQCLFVSAADDQREDLRYYIDHPWLQKRGYMDEIEKKALKGHLFEAINFKADKGGKLSKYLLSITRLEEVLNPLGEYNILALKLLIEIVCNFVLLKEVEFTQESFAKEIHNYSVCAPYFKEAPPILHRILVMICKEFVWKSPVVYQPEHKRKLEE